LNLGGSQGSSDESRPIQTNIDGSPRGGTHQPRLVAHFGLDQIEANLGAKRFSTILDTNKKSPQGSGGASILKKITRLDFTPQSMEEVATPNLSRRDFTGLGKLESSPMLDIDYT
jgi:hypothetical protein